jgi:D-hydroxyproline dehydrogenase subunit gamma
MPKRIMHGVERATPISILVDDVPIEAYPGETVAAALIAAGRLALGFNWDQRARGPVCNMGVCYECVVETRPGSDVGEFRLQRACMTPVRDGMVVRTTRHRA